MKLPCLAKAVNRHGILIQRSPGPAVEASAAQAGYAKTFLEDHPTTRDVRIYQLAPALCDHTKNNYWSHCETSPASYLCCGRASGKNSAPECNYDPKTGACSCVVPPN